MIRALLGLVPPWGWLLLGGITLATVAGWHFNETRLARVEGRADVQARWDAAEIARERTANADRVRRAEGAAAQSTAHEAARASIARALLESTHALQNALSAPITCAAGATVEVGDVVLPGAALAGVRAAAGGGGQRTD